MTTITYRKLNSDDAPDFKALRIEAAGESPASFYFDAEELRSTSISDFETQLRSSELQSVYGAFGGRELVGIIGLQRDAKKKIRHRAKVWGVYTKASYRGQGIARELMRALLDDVRSSGKFSLLYLSVHVRNIAAKALYRSIGFETYGLQRHSMLVDGEYIDEELMELGVPEVK